MKLTNQFNLEVFTKSSTAIRMDYEEQGSPSVVVVDNLQSLYNSILRPLYYLLVKMYQDNFYLNITSGYRCKRLNDYLKSSEGSDHRTGKAVDIELYINDKEENIILYDTIINSDFEFKQLIKEKGTSERPAWIHLSFDIKNNNKQTFTL
jgi:hypothetical protein